MKMETEIKQKPKSKAIVVGIAILVVLVVAFSALLLMFNSENQAVETQFMQEETTQSGYIDIVAKSFSVDPVKGDLSTRLQFMPVGDLAAADGSLAKDMTLYVNGATGKTAITFKKGEIMNPADVVIDIFGNIGYYPFDSHMGVLSLYLAVEKKNDAGFVTDTTMIPFTVSYSSALAGYHITPAMGEDSQTGYLLIDLSVSRASTAMTFAIFIMVLEWLLAASAIGATFVWVKGRKIEVGMFGWMGALLFALVPLRNAMPAVPPIGVLSDIIAFFWAEILVAVCLVISVFTWLRRGSQAGNAK